MLWIEPGAAGVEVAEIVGENLQLVGAEVAVVPQHVVVARSRGTVDALVAVNIKRQPFFR